MSEDDSEGWIDVSSDEDHDIVISDCSDNEEGKERVNDKNDTAKSEEERKPSILAMTKVCTFYIIKFTLHTFDYLKSCVWIYRYVDNFKLSHLIHYIISNRFLRRQISQS